MTRESLVAFYDQDYRPIYVGSAIPPEEFFVDQIKSGRARLDFIAPYVRRDHQPLTVFDVGCGAGGTLVPFRDSGWKTCGCDLGSEYLERGRAAGLHLEHGDITRLARYGKAHLVMLNHVLEHVPDPKLMLRQVSELLVESGHLYIELPGVFRTHRNYGDFLLSLQNAHLYSFTLSTLSNILVQEGFQLVKGNEHICALYRKDRSRIGKGSAPTGFRNVLAYLWLLEAFRITNINPTGRFSVMLLESKPFSYQGRYTS